MSGRRVIPKSMLVSSLQSPVSSRQIELTGSGYWLLISCDRSIHIRSPVAVELPDVADLAVLLQIELGHQHLLVCITCLGHNLAARVAEVASAVEIVVAERLHADAVDRADPVT